MVARHWLYFAGFVVSGLLVVGAGLMGILDGLSVLSGDVTYSEEFVLLAMLGEAAEWVVLVLALGLVTVIFFVAAIVSVLRRASLPRDDRLVSVVGRLEREFPLLAQFDVSETVEPTTEDRKRQLKEQYVAGEIDEDTFERKMTQLMDDTDADVRPRSPTETSIDLEDQPR